MRTMTWSAPISSGCAATTGPVPAAALGVALAPAADPAAALADGTDATADAVVSSVTSYPPSLRLAQGCGCRSAAPQHLPSHATYSDQATASDTGRAILRSAPGN